MPLPIHAILQIEKGSSNMLKLAQHDPSLRHISDSHNGSDLPTAERQDAGGRAELPHPSGAPSAGEVTSSLWILTKNRGVRWCQSWCRRSSTYHTFVPLTLVSQEICAAFAAQLSLTPSQLYILSAATTLEELGDDEVQVPGSDLGPLGVEENFPTFLWQIVVQCVHSFSRILFEHELWNISEIGSMRKYLRFVYEQIRWKMRLWSTWIYHIFRHEICTWVAWVCAFLGIQLLDVPLQI